MAASEPRASSIARMYDAKVADVYGSVMKEELKKVTDDLDRVLDGLPGGPVLDTSCGTGDMLAYMASKGRADLHGSDLAPAMLEAARKQCPSATLTVADMTSLPSWSDGACSAVLSCFAIHHVGPEVVPGAIKEWARILAPGGRLFLGAWEGEGEMESWAEEGAPKEPMYKYPMASLRSWVEAAGLAVDSARVTEDEMGMCAYLHASRPAEPSE